MPDTPSTEPVEEAATPAVQRPIRRLGHSILVAIQVVAFCIVLISVNYLSCARHSRIDLTERQDFTLSDFTSKLLKGTSVQDRKEPIRIIAVIRRGSPHYSRMRNLLDEYNRLGGDSVELEFVDPARQTDRTLEIAQIYGQPYIEDMIIVDGRSAEAESAAAPKTDGETSATDETDQGKTAEAAKDATGDQADLQQLSAHVRTVYVKQLYLEELDQFRNRFIAAWQDEDVITSSFIGAIEGRPRKIYFAADKSNLEASDGEPAWKVLASLLWQQNIQMVPVRLTDIQSIPKDAEGLALIAPQYDLSERELKMVTEYWDRPRSSLFITLDPSVELSNLRIFLRNYGITPRNDRVISVENKQTLSSVRAVFTRGAEINLDLGGKSTVFDGTSNSLEVRENDDQLMNKRIRPIALVQAADGWWGETRYKEENPVFNPEEDHTAPLYLAAAILRGQATSDDTAQLVSKMVVISNTDFLASKNTRPEQADFVKSSINWLVGREDLIGIGPRKLHRHKITLLDSHNTFISRLLLIFLPGAVILTSLIVWNVRRA
ncbi:hypothetical protein NT6N_39700 [Oceaniferula spumae]|uniref:DUF7088 domain-containing protein n=1 Tax=Oceaniferula spumae TaxID=2979115 RepID=A0AAT9FSL9_9BACT